jgi:hypothetical protein
VSRKSKYATHDIFHTSSLIFAILMGVLEQVMHFRGLYETRPNMFLVCNSLTIYCLVIQLITRLGSRYIKDDTKNMQALLKTVVTFYEREEQNTSHVDILNDHLKVSGFTHATNIENLGVKNSFLQVNPIQFPFLNIPK